MLSLVVICWIVVGSLQFDLWSIIMKIYLLGNLVGKFLLDCFYHLQLDTIRKWNNWFKALDLHLVLPVPPRVWMVSCVSPQAPLLKLNCVGCSWGNLVWVVVGVLSKMVMENWFLLMRCCLGIVPILWPKWRRGYLVYSMFESGYLLVADWSSQKFWCISWMICTVPLGSWFMTWLWCSNCYMAYIV